MPNMHRKKVNKKQEKCIEFMVDYPTMQQKEIAELVGIHEVTLCKWKRLDYFLEAYDEAIRQSSRWRVPKAIKKIEQLIDSENDQVALKASIDYADRFGFKAIEQKKVEHSGEVTNTNKNLDLSSLSVEELKKLAGIEPGTEETPEQRNQ